MATTPITHSVAVTSISQNAQYRHVQGRFPAGEVATQRGAVCADFLFRFWSVQTASSKPPDLVHLIRLPLILLCVFFGSFLLSDDAMDVYVLLHPFLPVHSQRLWQLSLYATQC